MCKACYSILSITVAVTACFASQISEIVKIDVDSSGRVHVADSLGKEVVVPLDKDQVNCSSVKIADDRHTVGWLAEYPSCCTSYPLPLTLVIYRGGKIIRRIALSQSIWDWRFVDGGTQVALWIGPTHGDFIPLFELHDVRSRKLISS